MIIHIPTSNHQQSLQIANTSNHKKCPPYTFDNFYVFHIHPQIPTQIRQSRFFTHFLCIFQNNHKNIIFRWFMIIFIFSTFHVKSLMNIHHSLWKYENNLLIIISLSVSTTDPFKLQNTRSRMSNDVAGMKLTKIISFSILFFHFFMFYV